MRHARNGSVSPRCYSSLKNGLVIDRACLARETLPHLLDLLRVLEALESRAY
jgi:hypothetical protein